MSAIIFIVIDVNVFWAGVGIVGPEQFICYTFFFFFWKMSVITHLLLNEILPSPANYI